MTGSIQCLSAQRPAFWPQFTGKERDAETGLDYFLARYYSGAQGRFLSPDEFKGGPDDALTGLDVTPPGPLPYADITNPQSLNKYTYTYNNPLRYTDPDGHCPICVVFAVGALIAFSSDTANAPGPKDLTIPRSGDGQILANSAIGGAIGYGLSKAGSFLGDIFGRSSAASTDKVLTDVATKAADTVGPGKGGVHGTLVHSEFEQGVKALGRSDLSTEVSYKGGQVVPRGTPGSVRTDVVQGTPANPTAVYDLKTGSAKLTPARTQQIQQQLPKKVPVKEIKPENQ